MSEPGHRRRADSVAEQRRRAEELYASAFAGQDAVDGDDLRALCGRHPELADEIQEVHARARRAREMIRRVSGQLGAGAGPAEGAEPGPALSGRRLSHYEVMERIGEGAMGEVYLARDTRLDREVALKVLAPRFIADEDHKSRFLREARLASRLSHANIATIHEANEAEGTLFFVMELVRGETLESKVRPGGLSTAEFLEVALPLADGLAEAHRSGVVHRDLKPANIMVDERGRPKILDFGLSRPTPDRAGDSPFKTASGILMGTPAFLAPERLKGERVDPKSDLFSLGAILYYLATGQRPFPGRTQAEALDAVLHRDPVGVQRLNPAMDDEIGWVIQRLLEKDPARRTQSAEELLAELRAIEARLQGGGAARRRHPWRPVLWAAAAVVALLAVFQPWNGVRGASPSLLAIVPFATPPDDPEAEALARTLLYALPQELAGPQVEVLSSTFLTDLAKQRGVAPGTLDSAVGASVAREAGADLMVVGRLERAPGGLDLYCELLDTSSGRFRASRRLHDVSAQAARDHILDLAEAIREPLGLSGTGEAPLLSRDPAALRFYADGLAAVERADWTAAEARLARATAADPGFALAHYHRARVLTWKWEADLEEAEAALAAAVRDPERLTPAGLEKAELLQELVRTEFSSSQPGFLERARRLALDRPRDKDALDLWMEFAHHHTVEGSATETMAACERLLQLDPDYASAFIHLQAAAAWAGDRGACRRASEGILRTAPDSADALLAYLVLDRHDEARRLIRERGLRPRIRRDRVLAIFAALGLGEAEQAEELAALGWQDDPGALRLYRADALLALGRFGEARETVQALGAVGESGESIPTRFALGLDPLPGGRGPAWGVPFQAAWLARAGDPHAARQALATLEAGRAESPRMRRLRQWAQGEIAAAEGEAGAALALFLEAAPAAGEIENGRVGQLAGFLVERAGRALTAAERWEEARKLLGRFDAEPELFRYVGRFQVKPVAALVRALYDRARCAEALGNAAEAQHLYGRFLSAWPGPDPAFPEIRAAHERFAALAGRPWGG